LDVIREKITTWRERRSVVTPNSKSPAENKKEKERCKSH